jgi:hypothetical protein
MLDLDISIYILLSENHNQHLYILYYGKQVRKRIKDTVEFAYFRIENLEWLE